MGKMKNYPIKLFWKTRDFEIQAESQFLFFLLEGGGGFKECSGVILTKNLD